MSASQPVVPTKQGETHMRIIKPLVGLAFAASLVACGPETRTVTLNAQNGSNESGTAKLTELDNGKTRVEITLSNGTATAQPAHIHNGTCATLGTVVVGLNDVTNGTSSTDVDETFENVKQNLGKWAINVHKSAAESNVYVSCGDIK